MAKSLDAHIAIPCDYTVIFYETKFMSISVLTFPQSYIGMFIVLLGTSVMSVGLEQILSYLLVGLV